MSAASILLFNLLVLWVKVEIIGYIALRGTSDPLLSSSQSLLRLRHQSLCTVLVPCCGHQKEILWCKFSIVVECGVEPIASEVSN
ncbi:hypothetical protein VNO77_04947 [Canavalia gladiata]|uniref:Uncharacterized protein n=1 Tax=Canavalia gladiata TaxID=3824 RepID=A0AAN9RDQ7_CANGL